MALVDAATPNGFAPTATAFDGNEPPGLAVAREHPGGCTALPPEQADNAEDATTMASPIADIDRLRGHDSTP